MMYQQRACSDIPITSSKSCQRDKQLFTKVSELEESLKDLIYNNNKSCHQAATPPSGGGLFASPSYSSSSPTCCKVNKQVEALLERCDFPEEELAQFVHFDPTKPYTRNLVGTDHETYTILLLCWQAGSPIHDHPGDACCVRVISGAIREKRYQLLEQQHSKNNKMEPAAERGNYSSSWRRSSGKTTTIRGDFIGDISTDTSATTTSDDEREEDFRSNNNNNCSTASSSCSGSESSMELIEVDSSLRLAGQVSYMHDSIGLHSIAPEAIPSSSTPSFSSVDASSAPPRAITMHIYMPPIKRCKVWPNVSNAEEVKEVEIPTTNCPHRCSSRD